MKAMILLVAMILSGAGAARAQYSGAPGSFEQVLAQALREAMWRSQLAREARPRKEKNPAPLPPLPPLSYVDVDACWSREPDVRADELGLPMKFCVKRIAIYNPAPGTLPFSYGAFMVVEGEPAQGRLHIGGGAGMKDHWNIVGNLFNTESKPACGTLNAAFAAVYIDVDLKGEILKEPNLEIRGFMSDGSSGCRQQAPARFLSYIRVP